MSGIIGVSPDMKSGVVGAFPAGSVIQQVSAVAGSNVGYTKSGSGDYADIVSKSITPRFSGSDIYIACKTVVRVPTLTASSQWFTFQVERRTVGEAVNAGDNIRSGMYAGTNESEGDTSRDWYIGYSYTLADTDHTASGTDLITYAFQFLPDYDGTWTAQHGSSIVLTEVAPL